MKLIIKKYSEKHIIYNILGIKIKIKKTSSTQLNICYNKTDAIIRRFARGHNDTPVILKNNVTILFRNTIFPNTIIGQHSYLGEYTKIDRNVIIGKYCSIANNVLIGATIHPQDWLSTSPFQYDNWLLPNVKKYPWKIGLNTTIGNDVWIGANVVIQSGVSIGDGAIIGSGAIVTKNVPPYSIVVGVPAKIIKYRFSDEIIETLLDLKWWNLPYKQICNLPFNNIQKCIKILKDSPPYKS